MTSATLYREGPDLDELLAELDEENPGLVRVVEVTYGRDGGVMGFFARRMIGVHYTLDAEADSAFDRHVADSLHLTMGEHADVHNEPDESPLEAMLRAAEMVESGIAPQSPQAQPAEPAPSRAPAEAPSSENVEFARMLLDMASQKAAERAASKPAPEPTVTLAEPRARINDAELTALLEHARRHPVGARHVPRGRRPGVRARAAPAAPSAIEAAAMAAAAAVVAPPAPAPVAVTPPAPVIQPAPAPVIQPAPAPVIQPAPAPIAVTPTAEPVPAAEPVAPPRTALTLRRQLAELGVPVQWIPNHSASSYLVVEHLVNQVPMVSDFDPEPGQILVVAGPATHAMAEATRLCTRLRIDPAEIRTAGCGTLPLTHRRQAASLAREIREEASVPCVVVVATDSTASVADATGHTDLAWAVGVVDALEPDHTVVVVDATSKVSDTRAMLRALPATSALAVVRGAATASPAALWDLGVPVSSLDGRPATRGGWAALLIDRLAELDGA